MANYKPPIGGIPSTVINLLLSIASAFTKNITHEPSRLMVDGFLSSFRDLVKALSDTDPGDEAQIKAIVNRFLTEGDFYTGSRRTILANIEKVGNEDARAALTIAMGIVYRLADVLTDDVDDNGRQLEEMMKVFLVSQDGVLFITSLVRLTGVDQSTADLIALLLIEALKGVISEDQQAALEDLRARLSSRIAA